MFISQLGKTTCWKFQATTSWKHFMQMWAWSALYWNKNSPSAKYSPVLVSASAKSGQIWRFSTLLQTVNLLSVMLKPLYEIHRPQTMSEQRDIDSPIRTETATWIKTLMRYEVDSQRGGDGVLSLPSSFLPLPGVLQITSPDPGVLASDWLQQAYLPNKACLIGPRETMACVNSPGALDSRPTQQSLC